MREMMKHIPQDVVVMGNISPVQQFRSGTVESITEDTLSLMRDLSGYNNFVISSGCDIPPDVDLDNVDTFFHTVEGFYYRQSLRNAIS